MKPTFIGIGTTKSGTTWLTECLKQHPSIYIPPKKELMFFVYPPEGFYNKGIAWYENILTPPQKEQSISSGEFTTQYMFYKESSKLIKENYPNVKLIVSLRNPIDMLYSFYWWKKANFEGVELPETFEEAVFSNKIDFQKRGFYYKQLHPYFKIFDKSQIKIILFEDIQKNPKKVIKDIFEFIGVSNVNVPNIHVHVNTAKRTKYKRIAKMVNGCINMMEHLGMKQTVRELIGNKTLSRIYSKINKQTFQYPPMNKETRKRLYKIYAKDIEQLSKLINRDLSTWQA